MGKIFAVIGEDARQLAAADYLRSQGYPVLCADETYRADYLLLPMPLSADKAGLARLLRAAKPGALAFGGRVSAEAAAAAEAAKVSLQDYFEREELAQLNAIPTAEGCIGLLLANRSKTLWGQPVLVLGYGRIGQAVARRLAALGARVTVAARKPGQQAMALADGCRAIPLGQLATCAAGQDTVVNTIPAPVLTYQVLAALGGGAMVVDLASLPGGTDFDAARQLGVQALNALSLPAKCAPQTAGEFVARAVLAMLEERGEL